MIKNRRSFSASKKLDIFNEADRLGTIPTLRKHNLSSSVLRRWREQYNEGGASKLQSHVRQRNPELEAANEQIRLLKNIVARQQMELEFKDELLKKTKSQPGYRSK